MASAVLAETLCRRGWPTGIRPALMSSLLHAKLVLDTVVVASEDWRDKIACALTPLMPKELVPFTAPGDELPLV